MTISFYTQYYVHNQKGQFISIQMNLLLLITCVSRVWLLVPPPFSSSWFSFKAEMKTKNTFKLLKIFKIFLFNKSSVAGTCFLAELVNQKRGEESWEKSDSRTQREEQLPAQTTVLQSVVHVKLRQSGVCYNTEMLISSVSAFFVPHLRETKYSEGLLWSFSHSLTLLA